MQITFYFQSKYICLYTNLCYDISSFACMVLGNAMNKSFKVLIGIRFQDVFTKEAYDNIFLPMIWQKGCREHISDECTMMTASQWFSPWDINKLLAGWHCMKYYCQGIKAMYSNLRRKIYHQQISHRCHQHKFHHLFKYLSLIWVYLSHKACLGVFRNILVFFFSEITFCC